MDLISLRFCLIWFLFLSFSHISCKQIQETDIKKVSPGVFVEKEKGKLLRDFYSQDRNALSQWEDYAFEHLGLLKDLMPVDENYSIWSKDTLVLSHADSVLKVIKNANLFGLQPSWYRYQDLVRLRLLLGDSIGRYDPVEWTKFELMMTNSFVGFLQDLRFGKLRADSIDLRQQRTLDTSMILNVLRTLKSGQSIDSITQKLEPRHIGYHHIKKMLAEFFPHAQMDKYTVVVFPWQDSLQFLHQLHQRLLEGGFIDISILETDSLKMSLSIKKAQQHFGLHKDGKAGKMLIAALNDWDQARYARMAINMDRYRMIPDTFPESNIIVNIPSYTLYARIRDTIIFSSKVIVGKPKTRSPLLNAVFSNIVVYPQWNVPESIIFKEIIPKMQKDPGYLESQNMLILDRRDSLVNPKTIQWEKANEKNFRYRIRQGEGLDNSLGIIKFNFPNPYAVYLHDTNARTLFNLEERSLSHGCIRVEKWMQVANFLTQPILKPREDTVITRLLKKEKKATRPLRTKTALYIRYFTLYDAGKGLKFYPDIYGEDYLLIDNYLY